MEGGNENKVKLGVGMLKWLARFHKKTARKPRKIKFRINDTKKLKQNHPFFVILREYHEPEKTIHFGNVYFQIVLLTFSQNQPIFCNQS